MRRAPKLDRGYCDRLIRGHSSCETVAAPFRGQLRAALLEIARLTAECDRLRLENRRLERDNKRLAPAADALLHVTRSHSNACVCPLCRAVRGTREIVAERVAAYRATEQRTGT